MGKVLTVVAACSMNDGVEEQQDLGFQLGG